MGNIFSSTKKCNICESPEESFETYRRRTTVTEFHEYNERTYEPERVELAVKDEEDEREDN